MTYSYYEAFRSVRNHLCTLEPGTLLSHQALLNFVMDQVGIISRVQYSDLLEALLRIHILTRRGDGFEVGPPNPLAPLPEDPDDRRGASVEVRLAQVEKELKQLKALIADRFIC